MSNFKKYLEATKESKPFKFKPDTKVSNCCGAKVIHGDMCSKCKEHCEVVEEGEDDGEAKISHDGVNFINAKSYKAGQKRISGGRR